MKKIIKKVMLVMMIIIGSFSLSGCFGFFEEEEALLISSINTNTLPNGNIQVVITYQNEDVAPTSFIIPKGNEGEVGAKGNGIREVSVNQKEDGTGSILTISYTDVLMEPTKIDIKDGVSISSITSSVDEETLDTIMIVNYSDGTSSEPITIPRGKDGEDGIGVIGIDQRINRDFSVTLTFKMSNEEEVLVQIPAPQQGEDGRGIESIVSLPSGNTYTMVITYTDGEVQELEFARPNKWFSEVSLPSNEEGINGDMWYDLAHNTIYVKQSNRWVEVINLNQSKENTYTIRFDLNDNNEHPASMPVGSLISYEIEEGKYFKSSGYEIPLPIREGYIFKGWYSVKNPSVINGAFNDLTSVYSDLTLYALWEEIK